MGTATKEEQRDELIAELAEKHLGKRSAGLVTGNEATITDVCNSVSDKLGSDDSVVRDLIVKSMGCSGRRVDHKAFGDLVMAVMRAEAEIDAIKEVEQLERAAKDDPDNCRPRRRMVQWMQEQEEKFS